MSSVRREAQQAVRQPRKADGWNALPESGRSKQTWLRQGAEILEIQKKPPIVALAEELQRKWDREKATIIADWCEEHILLGTSVKLREATQDGATRPQQEEALQAIVELCRAFGCELSALISFETWFTGNPAGFIEGTADAKFKVRNWLEEYRRERGLRLVTLHLSRNSRAGTFSLTQYRLELGKTIDRVVDEILDVAELDCADFVGGHVTYSVRALNPEARTRVKVAGNVTFRLRNVQEEENDDVSFVGGGRYG